MLTDNTKKRIIAQAMNGKHPIDIAREFMVHDTTVRKILNTAGVAYKARPRTGRKKGG